MRSHQLFAYPLGQVASYPLRLLPCVDEDDGCLMLVDEVGEPVVDLEPYLGRHDGFEGRARQVECYVQGSAVAFVDDRGSAFEPTKPVGYQLHGVYRG
jgi:hypothetical protein